MKPFGVAKSAENFKGLSRRPATYSRVEARGQPGASGHPDTGHFNWNSFPVFRPYRDGP